MDPRGATPDRATALSRRNCPTARLGSPPPTGRTAPLSEIVGVAGNEVLVVSLVPEDHVRQPQGEDPHASRPDLHPFGGVSAGLGHARVDMDHLQPRSRPLLFKSP